MFYCRSHTSRDTYSTSVWQPVSPHAKRRFKSIAGVLYRRETTINCIETFTSCFPLPGRGTSHFLPAKSQTTSLLRSLIEPQPATHALQTTRDNTQVYLCRTASSCNSLNVARFQVEVCRGTSGRGVRRLDKWDIYVCALFFRLTFVLPRTSTWNVSVIFVLGRAAVLSTFEDVAVVL